MQRSFCCRIISCQGPLTQVSKTETECLQLGHSKLFDKLHQIPNTNPMICNNELSNVILILLFIQQQLSIHSKCTSHRFWRCVGRWPSLTCPTGKPGLRERGSRFFLRWRFKPQIIIQWSDINKAKGLREKNPFKGGCVSSWSKVFNNKGDLGESCLFFKFQKQYNHIFV